MECGWLLPVMLDLSKLRPRPAHSHSKVRDSVLGAGNKTKPLPTGLSAYRMIIPAESIKDLPHAYAQCTQETWTSMLVGEKCRAIMGPCRAGELLCIVALVPDGEWWLSRSVRTAADAPQLDRAHARGVGQQLLDLFWLARPPPRVL